MAFGRCTFERTACGAVVWRWLARFVFLIMPRMAKQCVGEVGMRKGMQKMLEAKEISFAYSGGRVLYDGLSLQIAPGERVALCAPSGFGKTTLCRILAGYLKLRQAA
mgnify:CR=1 FL=1